MKQVCHSSLFMMTVVILTAAGSAGAADKNTDAVFVAETITFAEDSQASVKVQNECRLQTRLQEFIKTYSKNVSVEITREPLDEIEESGERVLVMEFSQVLGFGGGAWSGAKSVTVEGELRQDGEVIGSFTAARYSGGGAFAGFKGTCSIMGRCIKAIGRDIAEWLKNPTMGAALGDA